MNPQLPWIAIAAATIFACSSTPDQGAAGAAGTNATGGAGGGILSDGSAETAADGSSNADISNLADVSYPRDASVDEDATDERDAASERKLDDALGESGPERGANDGAVSDALATCTGPVLQGSFVIHNSVDVQTIASYARITGDLRIDAPGLTAVSLPLLCAIGGSVTEDNAPDLRTLGLPALISAAGFAVNGAPLHDVTLSQLRSVTQDMTISSDGPLDLSKLESAGGIYVWKTPTQVDLSALAKVGNLSVVCSETCGPSTASALASSEELVVLGTKLTAPKLTQVKNFIVNAGDSDIDAPLLQTITGDFWFMGDPGSKNFSALVSVGGTFTLLTHAPSMIFPALQSIGGQAKFQGAGAAQSYTFPVLSSVGADVVTIDLDGTFLAPSLVKAQGGLFVRRVFSLDLSGLQSVGAPNCMTPLDMANTTISTLQLPSLTSACILLGAGRCTVLPPDSGPILPYNPNPALVSIVAPNLTNGGIAVFANPSLPKCRADALIAQIVNPISSAEVCPLASGPCP